MPNKRPYPLPEDESNFQALLNIKILLLWELMTERALYDVELSSIFPQDKAEFFSTSHF